MPSIIIVLTNKYRTKVASYTFINYDEVANRFHILVPNFNFSAVTAICLSLSDSMGPVFFTII